MKISSILAQPLIFSSISSEVICRYFLIYTTAGTRSIILEKEWIVHTREKVYIAEHIFQGSKVYENPRQMRVSNKVSYHRGEKSFDFCLTGVAAVAVETAVVMASAAMVTMTAAVGAVVVKKKVVIVVPAAVHGCCNPVVLQKEPVPSRLLTMLVWAELCTMQYSFNDDNWCAIVYGKCNIK